MNSLENKVAVVTGASSGIGRAIALGLAAAGANLCLVGRRLETLRSVADAAKRTSSRIESYQADLAVNRELDAFLAHLLRADTPVDILVHSAGAIRWGPLADSSADELDCQYRINLRAPCVLTRGLLPPLKSSQGQVLFVNSSAALTAKANVGQYAATKHALKAFADSLRDEVNPAGVRVLSLFLGRTATPMQAGVHAMEGRAYHPELLMQPEDVAAVVVHALCLPRSVEITDISMRPFLRTY